MMYHRRPSRSSPFSASPSAYSSSGMISNVSNDDESKKMTTKIMKTTISNDGGFVTESVSEQEDTKDSDGKDKFVTKNNSSPSSLRPRRLTAGNGSTTIWTWYNIKLLCTSLFIIWLTNNNVDNYDYNNYYYSNREGGTGTTFIVYENEIANMNNLLLHFYETVLSKTQVFESTTTSTSSTSSATSTSVSPLTDDMKPSAFPSVLYSNYIYFNQNRNQYQRDTKQEEEKEIKKDLYDNDDKDNLDFKELNGESSSNTTIPCQPEKIHLSQSTNVHPSTSTETRTRKTKMVVNMTLSFTLSRQNCPTTSNDDDTILPIIIYGNVEEGNVEGIVSSYEKVNFHFNSQTTKPSGTNYTSDDIYHMIVPNLQAGRQKYWYKIILLYTIDTSSHEAKDGTVGRRDGSDNDSAPSTSPWWLVNVRNLILLPAFFFSATTATTASTTTSPTLHLRGSQGHHQRHRRRMLYFDNDDVKNKNNNNGLSSLNTFITPPISYQPTTLALVGDLGQTENSTKTMYHIYQATAVAELTTTPAASSSKRMTYEQERETSMMETDDGFSIPVSAVLIAGDLAYADGDPYRWESWFELMEPLLKTTPIFVAAGNHEIECDDITHDIFIPYESYFRVPNRIQSPDMVPVSDEYRKTLWKDRCTTNSQFLGHYNYGNAFYDFVHGLAHVIVLNSYTDTLPGSVQYQWLEKTLNSTLMNRHETPWLIVMFHCPLHTTFLGHNDELNSGIMLKSMEPLFVQYHVNLIISGHDHAYMRTHSMYGRDNVDRTDRSPIYLTLGAGGNREQHTKGYVHPNEKEEWVIKRDNSEYGYGHLLLSNATHGHFHWVRDSTTNEGIQDDVWFENQFYL